MGHDTKDDTLNASEMIDRVKKLAGCETDYALEKLLDMRPSTIQQARKNGGNTAPWKLLRVVLSDAALEEQ